MAFNVHPYTTEADALAAVESLDVQLGYPRGDALHYTGYYPIEGQFCIIADAVTETYLTTQPITINTESE